MKAEELDPETAYCHGMGMPGGVAPKHNDKVNDMKFWAFPQSLRYHWGSSDVDSTLKI